MSNAIVEALENAARQIVEALGRGVKTAEQKLLHSTADNLEQAATRHVEHDARAAEDIEAAGRGMHATDDVRGGGSGITPVESESGAGSSLDNDLPGATELPTPTRPITSNADYPYLRPANGDREVEAIPGIKPTQDPFLEPGGDPRTPPPPDKVTTFDGPVRPYDLEPGVTYYRSIGYGPSSYPNGSFWTTTPPTESQLRSDIAVLNEWNGDHGVVEFTPNQRITVGWEGEVAPQPATGGGDFYLPGGGRQIWVPPGYLNESHGHWQIAPAPEEAN